MSNVENIRKWVEALRSGEFEQTMGALCTAEEKSGSRAYCCLGVAAEVYRREHPDTDEWVPVLSHDPNIFKIYDEDAILPDVVQDWLELLTDNPPVWQGGTKHPLTEINDSGHYTFAEIADLIEETYLTERA